MSEIIGPGHPDFWNHEKFFPQMKIRTKSGALRPFHLWSHQRVLNAAVQFCYHHKKWLVHVKPRQEGSSTFFAGVVYQHVAYRTGCYGAVLANTKDTAKKLNEMVRRFWRSTPEAIRTPRNPQVRRYLEFPELDSIMTIAGVKDDEPLRGDTCQVLLATEVSSWPSSDVWVSALNAVPDDGGFVMAESTPKHWGDQLHKLLQEAEKPGSRWHPVFIPWDKVAQYSVEPPPGWSARPIVADYAHQFGLTPAQAYWMQAYGIPKCGGSVEKFRAEYPIDLSDCFTLSGEPIFDSSVILRWLRDLDGGTGLAREPKAEVYYQKRKAETQYMIIIDPAGSWSRRDNFGVTAWSIQDCELVYEFEGHSTAAQIAANAVKLGRMYRRGDSKSSMPALIVVEANGLGEAVLSHLIETHNYPNVFYRTSTDPINPNNSSLKPGFWNSSTTKASAIAHAQEMVRTESVTIRSVRLLRQILQYRGQWDRIARGRRDDSGGHFDLAITFFIFAWVYSHLSTTGRISAKRDPQKIAQQAWDRIQEQIYGRPEEQWNTPWGTHR